MFKKIRELFNPPQADPLEEERLQECLEDIAKAYAGFISHGARDHFIAVTNERMTEILNGPNPYTTKRSILIASKVNITDNIEVMFKLPREYTVTLSSNNFSAR